MNEAIQLYAFLLGKRIAAQRPRIPGSGRIIPEGGVYYIGDTQKTLNSYTKAKMTLVPGEYFPNPILADDIYVYGDYEYRYNKRYSGSSWTVDTTLSGWGARVLDATKSTYPSYLENINGKQLSALSYTFRDCDVITEISDIRIPHGVTNAYGMFYGCENLKTITNFEIPSWLTDASYMFAYCNNLEDISGLSINNGIQNLSDLFYKDTLLGDVTGLVIPESVTNMYYMFAYCENMSGTIYVNTESLKSYSRCFYGTTKPITLVGTGTAANRAVLELLVGTANNGNVTIA